MKKLQISKKPTFDVDEIEFLQIDLEDQILFLKSKQVFYFDKVYGVMQNRSRVLRPDKNESKLVENVIAAVIDAGFCGNLFWKLKLTKAGVDIFKNSKVENFQELVSSFKGCQQLYLHPTLNQQNYYEGTNQTDLIPDLVFEI